MTLLQTLLHVTNFKSPLLRNVVPCMGAAFAMQAAFGLPSVALQSERFYDFSGALTNIAVTALSLYLPSLRAREAAGLGDKAALLSKPLSVLLNWRQLALSAAAMIWATRLGTYLFGRILTEGKDSRFDTMKKKPVNFFVAWMVQALWCTVILMPVMAINAVPAAALAAAPAGVRVTDVVGLALFTFGLGFEAVADAQKSRWMREKKTKVHDEVFMHRGLWTTSQYPNYFGETCLWTGIATTAAGALVTRPVQLALGFSGTVLGQLGAASLALISPAFTAFVLLKISGVPLSERKYNRLYGDRKDYQEYRKSIPKFFPKLF